MKYRLIGADFDGTTADETLTLSDELKQAVKEYSAAGGVFTFATGRAISSILPYARALGLKGDVIAYQGAVVADIATGKIIQTTAIPYTDGAEVAEFLENDGVYFQIYEGDKFVVAQATEESIGYAAFTQMNVKVTKIKLSEYIRAQKLTTVKFVVIISADIKDGYLKRLESAFGNRFLINTSRPTLIEIGPNNVDKGLALLDYGKRLGIGREAVAAIGDSMNDVPMLLAAGLSAAVANATDEAKKAAGIIVPSCKDGGVAYFIRKVLAGEI